MNKQDDQEVGGCGGNCRCACGPDESEEVCEAPKEGVVIDKDGKCPCGKELKDCCHKDEIVASEENEALHELCEPHNGKHVCDIDSDLKKTAP